MNSCLDCDIDTKLDICCRSHPITFESKGIKLDSGRVEDVCPHFTSDEKCILYQNGYPQVCEAYHCQMNG